MADHSYISEISKSLKLLAADLGTEHRSRYSWSSGPDVLIEVGPGIRAHIIQDSVRVMARTSATQTTLTILPARGYELIQIEVYGESCFIGSLSSDDSEITLFKPGPWESYFGVSSAPGIPPILPWLFEDKRDPRWLAFLASPRSKWPPSFDGSTTIHRV